MSYDDLVYMVRTDMNLGEDISQRDIQIAYSKAKNVVVNEQERISTYKSVAYNEFLEFIARIVEPWFAGTEMENIFHYRKVEYFLEQMLALNGAKVDRQQIKIPEFNNSDDDY